MSPHDGAHAAVGVARGEPGEHLRAGVDADDVDVAGRDRDGQSTGADTELEHAWPPVARPARASSTTTSALTSASLMPGVPVVVHVGEGGAVGLRACSPPSRPVLHSVAPSPRLAGPRWYRLIYLDHAATTPMRAEAVAAMLPFLTERYGNPSGAHRFARDARRAVDEARDVVAEVIGCRPGEVVFTGGGTEADNAAIVGAVRRHGGRAGVLGHRAPRRAASGRARSADAWSRVDAAGRVDLDALAARARRRRGARLRDGGQQRGRHDHRLAAVAEIVRDARARARCCTPTPCRRRAWLDLRDAVAARRPGVAQRPQVRRSEGRRRAGGRARAPCSSR